MNAYGSVKSKWDEEVRNYTLVTPRLYQTGCPLYFV